MRRNAAQCGAFGCDDVLETGRIKPLMTAQKICLFFRPHRLASLIGFRKRPVVLWLCGCVCKAIRSGRTHPSKWRNAAVVFEGDGIDKLHIRLSIHSFAPGQILSIVLAETPITRSTSIGKQRQTFLPMARAVLRSITTRMHRPKTKRRRFKSMCFYST